MSREGSLLRPNYLYGVLHAAHLASKLGVPAISAVEFGVGSGGGLLSLERAAGHAEQALGVGVDVVGFDTGRGLPRPSDVRDCPNLFAEGQYALDESALRDQLDRASLVLGLIAKTLPRFVASGPRPVGFIAFDVDLYSSARDALRLLEAPESLLLPRIQCYFDDITGFTYADHNGERLAIAEFNATHADRKVSKVYEAEFYVPRGEARALWPRKLYMAHVLDHSRYGEYDGLVQHDVIE